MNEQTDRVTIFRGETWNPRRMLYQEMIKLAGRLVDSYTTDVLYDIDQISQLTDEELEGKLWGLRTTGTSFDNILMDNERWYIIEMNDRGEFYLSRTYNPK